MSYRELLLEAKKRCFAENVASLAAALKVTGNHALHIEYTGSGDSGDDCEVTLISTPEYSQTKTGEPDDHLRDMPFQDVRTQWNAEAGRYDEDLHYEKETSTDIDEFANLLIDQVLFIAGNEGYENDDGGRGLLVVTATGAVSYEHANYYVEEDLTVYNSNDLLPGLTLETRESVAEADQASEE